MTNRKGGANTPVLMISGGFVTANGILAAIAGTLWPVGFLIPARGPSASLQAAQPANTAQLPPGALLSRLFRLWTTISRGYYR